MTGPVTISALSARWACWAIEAILHLKHRELAELRAGNYQDPIEIAEVEGDISHYNGALTEIREQL